MSRKAKTARAPSITMTEDDGEEIAMAFADARSEHHIDGTV
jgi:hypothetical protein